MGLLCLCPAAPPGLWTAATRLVMQLLPRAQTSKNGLRLAVVGSKRVQADAIAALVEAVGFGMLPGRQQQVGQMHGRSGGKRMILAQRLLSNVLVKNEEKDKRVKTRRKCGLRRTRETRPHS